MALIIKKKTKKPFLFYLVGGGIPTVETKSNKLYFSI